MRLTLRVQSKVIIYFFVRQNILSNFQGFFFMLLTFCSKQSSEGQVHRIRLDYIFVEPIKVRVVHGRLRCDTSTRFVDQGLFK